MVKTLEKCRKDEIHKIENYEQAINDKTQTWHCHHRLELTLDGEFAHTSKELERFGMYSHRPYFELIFLTEHDHKSLHGVDKALSQQTKDKLKEQRKKQRPGMKGILPYNTGKPSSEFGIKFHEHYGITHKDDPHLYSIEHGYWRHHNHKCSWE